MTSSDLSELIERLEKRAAEDEQCAANNQAVVDALEGQMKHFDARDGLHNTYAVRLAVDHRHSMKRDLQYAADLRAAIQSLKENNHG